MLTPKRRGWPGWSPKTPSPPPPAEEMADSSHVVTPTATAGGSSGGRALVEAPPRNLLDNNGEIVAARGDPEIWRRFREAGSLDEESLEKKDRAALVVHVTKLEAEEPIMDKASHIDSASEKKSSTTPEMRSCRKKKSDDASFVADLMDHIDEFVHASMDEHKTCFEKTIKKMFGMSKIVAEKNASPETVESVLHLRTTTS